MSKIINKIIFYLLITISFLSFFSYKWLEKTFGLLTLDSLIFHINVPLKDTSFSMIISYIFNPLLKTVLAVIVLIMLIIVIKKLPCHIFLKLKLFKFSKTLDLLELSKKFKSLFALIFLFLIIIFVCEKLEVREYLKNLNTYSSFIENNYVDPEDSLINFEVKKNLIHIFVESLEQTYTSYENGGAFEENLIPNLTNYANNEGISFKTSLNGGFLNSRSTGWTIAGMVAQTAGIGFLVPGDGNDYGKYATFLPGAYSLGQILDKNGYNQVLLLGSDATFGGRKDYFEQHGKYVIKDYSYALKNKWIPSDYYVWWGYEDSKLFEFAKNELIELSQKEQPFNLTFLTTNTHHIGGYLEDDCELKYSQKFKNVINCTDKQIYDFIEWLKKQDFYKNTTVVITGDHLSMDPTFFEEISPNYIRTNYNVFLNASKNPINVNNRKFNSLDIYPTIIGSLGGVIEGDRLGLGTDMFSSTPTLYEEYGIDYVDNEFAKNSLFFKEHIL